MMIGVEGPGGIGNASSVGGGTVVKCCIITTTYSLLTLLVATDNWYPAVACLGRGSDGRSNQGFFALGRSRSVSMLGKVRFLWDTGIILK